MPNATEVKIADTAELSAHLKASAVVEVLDQDGSHWGFEIRPVEPALLDPSGVWYAQLLAGDAEAFHKRLQEAVLNPPPGAIRAVVLRGVARPQLSEVPAPGVVWVDDLMRRDLLSRHLYAEIMKVTLEGLFTVTTQ